MAKLTEQEMQYIINMSTTPLVEPEAGPNESIVWLDGSDNTALYAGLKESCKELTAHSIRKKRVFGSKRKEIGYIKRGKK